MNQVERGNSKKAQKLLICSKIAKRAELIWKYSRVKLKAASLPVQLGLRWQTNRQRYFNGNKDF
jgi:hypothetical protein